MSHRRWRKYLAPGVSPGIDRLLNLSPRRGRQKVLAGEGLYKTLCRPLRGFEMISSFPRAHARGYFLPPALAGSLSFFISLDSLLKLPSNSQPELESQI